MNLLTKLLFNMVDLTKGKRQPALGLKRIKETAKLLKDQIERFICLETPKILKV